MRPTVPTAPAALLLAAALIGTALLAGCTGNDDGDRAGEGESPTAPASTEPSQAPEPSGFLVDRPSYSFYLPSSWEDTTEEHVYVSNDDTFKGAETSSAINAGTLSITHEQDVPMGTLDQQSKSILESLSTAHPGIEWGKRAQFAGVPSLHAVMPGFDEGTTFEAFYMIRDGDSTLIEVQSRGGRKASQKMVDQIESNWTWK